MNMSPCPLCKSKDAKLKHSKKIHGKKYDIAECQKCRLTYVNPLPTQKELSDFYTNQFDYTYLFAANTRLKKANNNRAKKIREIKPQKNATLLDVGCGSGQFLDAARKQGFQVTGIEVGKDAAEHARKTYDLTIIESDLTAAKLPTASYDIVCLHHVLEHLSNPASYLSEIRRLLKPKGLLVIQTPNIGGLPSRLFGKNWEWITPPKHLTYFTPKTLARILEENGFTVEKTETVREDAHSLLLQTAFAALHATGLADKVLYNPKRRNESQSKLFSLYLIADQISEFISAPFRPIGRLLDREGLGPEVSSYARPKGR
ncbi:Ubiquinone biosynthesis O-methyltransferase [uncultured archaeon]|nr:Ubiquinone biosynthesis O-methyltransferase [uncultured archaeon]